MSHMDVFRIIMTEMVDHKTSSVEFLDWFDQEVLRGSSCQP